MRAASWSASAERPSAASAATRGAQVAGRLRRAEILRALEHAGGAIEAARLEQRRRARAELPGALAPGARRPCGGGVGGPHRRPAIEARDGAEEHEGDEPAVPHARYSPSRTVAASDLASPAKAGTRALRNLRATHSPAGVPANGSPSTSA